MGMCAEIIAIGPYSNAVRHFLDYGPDVYTTVQEGATITCRLFGIMEGSRVSREFSALLGVADPWDFNQHRLQAPMVDAAGLRRFSERYPDYSEDVEAMLALMDAGFELHFRPEG